MSLTPPPTAPSRSNPPNVFIARMDAFLAWIVTFVAEMNLAIADIAAKYTSVLSNASTASTKAAEAAASAAAAAVNAPMWSSGNYNVGAVVWSPLNYKTYRARTTGAKPTDPMLDPTNWGPAINDYLTAINPLAKSQAIHLTYAGSAATGFQIADSVNLNMGVNDFGYHGLAVALPDYTPAIAVALVHKHDGTNGVIFSLGTNGKLSLQINATVYESTVTTGLEDFMPAVFDFAVGRSSVSAYGEVRFFVNGEQLGAPVAIAIGTPVTVSNTAALYIMGTSTTRMAGSVYGLGGLYNRKLSAVEVRRRGMAGIDASDKYGKQLELTTNGSFTGSATGWSLGAGFAYGTNNIVVTAASGNMSQSVGLVIGKKYRVTWTISITGGTGFALNLGLGGQTAYRTVSGTYSEELVVEPGASNDKLYIVAIGSPTGTIDDVSVVQIGSTFALESDGIQLNQWQDSGSNKLHAAFPASGTSLARLADHGVYRWSTPITGDTTLTAIVPPGFELDKIVFNNSTANAVSVRLGTTAGGTDVFSLTALNTSATLGGFKTVGCNQAFSLTAAQTLYLSSTSWGGASLTATFYFRRIA